MWAILGPEDMSGYKVVETSLDASASDTLRVSAACDTDGRHLCWHRPYTKRAVNVF